MIRCSVIGAAGYWSNNIIRCLLENNDVEISVLCDLNEKRLFEVAKKFRLYGKSILSTEYQDIKSSEVDAVFVCTPAKSHFEIAKHFLNMGKHTFVEKPLTMNVVDALELNAIVDSYSNKQYIGNNKPISIKMMAGHVFLYSESVKKINDLIKDDKIIYITSRRLNLGRIQSDINAMWSLMPHDLSIINHLMDSMPDKIEATGHCYISKDIEDVVFVNLIYPNNRFANVQVSWLNPLKTREMTIVCEKKMIVYDDCDNDTPIKVYDKGVDYIPPENERAYSVKLRSGDIWCPKIKAIEPLKTEIDVFIDWILNDKEPPISAGTNGLEIVEVLDKAQKSLEKNRMAPTIMK
jgi:predicted dehydrogenase